ncbi:MAG: sugar-binding protein, partial [bacterium]
EKTSIKLKFPIELGDLSRIVETTKSENSVSLKAIFSKRDLDYEVKKYEKEISINSKNIGKLVFYEEPDHNVRIVLYLDTNKYNVNYKLTGKNSVEVEVEEK